MKNKKTALAAAIVAGFVMITPAHAGILDSAVALWDSAIDAWTFYSRPCMSGNGSTC